MLRNGRPPDHCFAPDEPLYFRYGVDDFVAGQLNPAVIRVPGQSFNRGRFSQAEDVLFHGTGEYNGLGAIEFRVDDVPSTVMGEQGSTFEFFVRHAPLDHNYSHTEIWSVRPHSRETCTDPSKSVKLKFRVELCRRIGQDRIRIPAVRSRV